MDNKDFDRIDKKLGLKPTKKQVNSVKYRFSYSIFHDNYSPFHKSGKNDLEYQLDLMIWDNDLKVWKDPNYIFDVPKRVVNRFIYETPTPKGHNPRGRGWYPENNQKSSIWKKLHFKKYGLCHECGIKVHKPRKRRGKLNSRMPKYCLDCK